MVILTLLSTLLSSTDIILLRPMELECSTRQVDMALDLSNILQLLLCNHRVPSLQALPTERYLD